MAHLILKLEIRYEHDIVLVRQRARTTASLIGLDNNDQTRISTAVSEIARNAFYYAGGGEVEFIIEERERPQLFLIRIYDNGPGIPDVSLALKKSNQSMGGIGHGIIGAKRLMDYFHIESTSGSGTTVLLGKKLPRQMILTASDIEKISVKLKQQPPQTSFEEVQQQNQELLRAMQEIKERQEELEALNKELEDTNRGIVALYAELDEKAHHLNRANELKVRFLSNMSHEFRTPLNSIMALSGLLIDQIDGELNDEQKKQALYIKKAAQDLSSLVNDLLDIARIDAGRTEVNVVEFDVETLFSTLRGMLKPVLVNPAVNMIFETKGVLPLIYTDESKVSQILRNLISNAIKFTEKGEIRVCAMFDKSRDNVIFSVSDTGIGIAEEDLKRIFEEYTQVSSALQKKYKGTGLGLPLSQKLAKLLGGQITVESVPGAGSTFSAVIPARYKEAQSDEPETSLIFDDTKRPILVVEDDETTIAIYEKYLKGSGFQILPARSLRQARNLIQKRPPLAIILDILLPGEDGWGFLLEIKSDETTRHIPVFVISILEDQDKGFSLGAEDIAVKPVDRKWLLEKLRSVSRHTPIEKVLIIDDEEMSRYITKGLLADTKYAILEASSGKEGLKLAKEEKPSIIFLDLMMPDMDGFETLSRLKEEPETQNIPVIILTSKILDETERRNLSYKTMAVLSKDSVSRVETIASIRNAISKYIE